MIDLYESRLGKADKVISCSASLSSLSIVLSFLDWLLIFVNSYNELYSKVLFSDVDDDVEVVEVQCMVLH